MRVQAAGLNRADSLQRRGHYPPPAGASSVYGLEIAGVVEAVGEGVDPALVASASWRFLLAAVTPSMRR